jgi:hypothetical protein
VIVGGGLVTAGCLTGGVGLGGRGGGCPFMGGLRVGGEGCLTGGAIVGRGRTGGSVSSSSFS